MLLVGGNTLGNDFTDAFEQRFHKQADSKHHVNCDFISSKFRANSQWKGAVIMAEMNEETTKSGGSWKKDAQYC